MWYFCTMILRELNCFMMVNSSTIFTDFALVYDDLEHSPS